jgi:hypothetical protein
VFPAAERTSPAILDRFAHYHELKNELDDAWAVGRWTSSAKAVRTTLVLEDPCSGLLDRLLGAPIEGALFAPRDRHRRGPWLRARLFFKTAN